MCDASVPTRLAVIGAGAWGTVLALLLSRNGHQVTLWARRKSQAEAISRNQENAGRLPGVPLPAELEVTSDMDVALSGSAAAFLVVPSVAVREVAASLAGVPVVVSCSKGLTRPALTRLSELVEEAIPGTATAVLSGPNLAAEIAAGLPAAAVAASTRPELADRVQGWLKSKSFRVYTSPDPIGAEVGGALKNVIALAAGMSDGLRLGDNAKASILTRGLVEIVRLGVELGGRRETLYGLAGLGDMVATCSSRGSRNHIAGERIATGASVSQLISEGLTAEGIPTVEAVRAFAQERDLSLPICQEVYQVTFEGKDPRLAIEDLMARARRAEW